MTDHDPLCRYKVCVHMPSTLCRCNECQCDLIRKARESNDRDL